MVAVGFTLTRKNEAKSCNLSPAQDLRDPLEKMSQSKSQEDEKEEEAAHRNAHR